MSDHTRNIYSAFMASQDLISALGERPRIFLWLIKILMGKYAWHEFIIIKRHADAYSGYDLASWGYQLRDSKYHKKEEYTKWDYRPDWGREPEDGST